MTTVGTDKPHCWVLTDGKAGMVAQARGLAEATGIPFEEKVLRGGFPWRMIPASLWPPGVMGLSPRSVQLTPPWPALVISCGRHAVGPALEVKRRSNGRTVAVHIQHPRVAPARFDLIVAPKHDRLSGPNVVETHGSVHGLTRSRLDEAARHWKPHLDHLPRPRVAVLIGGSNGVYRVDEAVIRDIADRLSGLAKDSGCGLMVTPSRRTGAENVRILRDALSDTTATVWDLQGENPYFGYLGLADYVLATGDSVNMVSEAVATGKPVLRIDLPVDGRDEKFRRFHKTMEDAGAIRPFTGTLESWDVPDMDDTARAAARIHALVAAKGA